MNNYQYIVIQHTQPHLAMLDRTVVDYFYGPFPTETAAECWGAEHCENYSVKTLEEAS